MLVLLLRCFAQAGRNESGALPDFLTGYAGPQLPLIGRRFSEKLLGSPVDLRRLKSHFLTKATVAIRGAFTNSEEALYLVVRPPSKATLGTSEEMKKRLHCQPPLEADVQNYSVNPCLAPKVLEQGFRTRIVFLDDVCGVPDLVHERLQ